MAHSHTDPPTQPLYAPPQQNWWARLNPVPRAMVIIGGALGVVIFGCCGPLMVLGVLPGFGPSSAGDQTEQAAPTHTGYLSTTDPAAHEQVSIPSTLPAPLTTDVPTTLPAPPTTTTRTTTKTTTTKTSTKTTTKSTTKTTTKTSTAKCHSSYADVCVPVNVEDVDCYGGGGNGPYYVKGPVRIVGPDVYRLDNDGDGIACEN